MAEHQERVVVERDGGVVTIANNDAPINRMSLEYIDEVEAIIADIETDSDVRAVVFTAAGDENFSVGMDLKQLMSEADSRGGFEAVLDQRRRVLAAIENLHKPTISTLFGYCLGGGLELPLACHFRLAAEDGAKIGFPELDLGTVPAWGGTARLTRCVGRAAALDMILRAKRITGPEALRVGLVQEVHPNDMLKERAHELAREIARMPPIAVAGVLDCLVGASALPLDDALDREREAVNRCSGTRDQIEGMMAFIEKREPKFVGE